MKYKVLLAFIFFFMGGAIMSCIMEVCDEGPVKPYFEVAGLSSQNIKFADGKSEVLEAGASIGRERFFVRFSFKVNYISNVNTDFGSQLMALSCDVAGYAGDKIGVDTIIVRTLYDYNSNYSTGEVINDIVLTNLWTSSEKDLLRFEPLEYYLAENSEGIMYDGFDLKLAEPPTINSLFALDITYRLNNGNEYRIITSNVYLKR